VEIKIFPEEKGYGKVAEKFLVSEDTAGVEYHEGRNDS